MRKIKVMTIYGTRPEAIKIAPVVRLLENDDRFDSVVVCTGQHKEILDQVNQMFGIRPDHNLNLMKHAQSLNTILSRAIAGLDVIISDEKPDVVLVQGDTATAVAGALAGFNRGAKVVHLEAGLRTGNIRSPFPEEANRKIITQIADLHLAPTSESRRNLRSENVDTENIVITGNTVIDAFLEAARWESAFNDSKLAELTASKHDFVIITAHRRENLLALDNIGGAVKQLASEYPDIYFVMPLHPNPKIRDSVLPHVEDLANVVVTEPLPYDQFTRLQSLAKLILTDSGGIQEEAPSLGKPVLVRRSDTERPEAVLAGTVKLIGNSLARIVSETRALIEDQALYTAMASAVNPYGDGQASTRTVAALACLMGSGDRVEDFDPENHNSEARLMPDED
ncbi:non-hydrolyzing UDP-N-acetylglucosamine 2-epimerase [uncultured Corynebacterium sp.]|uniref:non-hydrolyzing UDP-N-acetylglucosamine 2-epimerase n=1 Tax=uncultured Corynebacterium sp. TaxID=159447 RepID=UPI0025CF0A54|nr:UDP-N-acetylglucosamine 2-epimerase (non-hydrolyzing) [uncultured Corynebacterium sp.]